MIKPEHVYVVCGRFRVQQSCLLGHIDIAGVIKIGIGFIFFMWWRERECKRSRLCHSKQIIGRRKLSFRGFVLPKQRVT